MENLNKPKEESFANLGDGGGRWLFRHNLLTLCMITLLLSGCASSFKKPHALKEKEPIYIQASGKAAYHFSLMVTRQFYRHQTKIVDSLADANTLVKINSPKCNRYVIFTDASGQRRDHLIKCELNYEVQSLLSENSGRSKITSNLIATSLLSRTDSVTGYFRREAEIEEELHQDLAKQLVTALATISF